MRLRHFLIVSSACLLVTAAHAAEPARSEIRGKEIYMLGTGDITATLDGGASGIPATTLPCANCHGADGRGRPEGGVTPSDITFDSLRRAYAVTAASGRTHGPYDDAKLKRAITRGIDSSGNRLDVVMPRYTMPPRDLDALVSSMKHLGKDVDPGVAARSVRLGIILPPHETMPEASTETRAIVEAWFDDVNERGGIFGRNVETVFIDPAGTPNERAAAVRAFVDGQRIFALVCSFSEGAERELASLAEEKRIPFVATITSDPRSSVAPQRYTRELFAGLAEQSRALLRVAARDRPETKRIAIIASGSRTAGIRDAAVDESRSDGFSVVEAVDAGAVDAAKLRADGVNTILILDPGPLPELVSKMDEWKWGPMILAPASVVGPDILARAPTTSVVSFPTLPTDYDDASVATHTRLINEHHIATTHRAIQAAALASASLVTDALTRAGRNLSREALLDAIDHTNAFRSGFAPPLTFRDDRHLGSTGCYVIAFQPGHPPKSAWIETE